MIQIVIEMASRKAKTGLVEMGVKEEDCRCFRISQSWTGSSPEKFKQFLKYISDMPFCKGKQTQLAGPKSNNCPVSKTPSSLFFL